MNFKNFQYFQSKFQLTAVIWYQLTSYEKCLRFTALYQGKTLMNGSIIVFDKYTITCVVIFNDKNYKIVGWQMFLRIL